MSANTQDLQWHASPTRTWFLALVKRTIAAQVSTSNGSKLSGESPGNSRHDLNRQFLQSNDPQGMYIVGADGSAYGFTNDHGPEDIVRFMDLCLKRYRANPPKPVSISDADIRAPFSIVPPADAQVLQIYARIPSPPGTCSLLNNGVGRDFCWVYAPELNALAALGGRPVGTSIALPSTLTRRIARFHLVDDVRGTPNLWEADEIRGLNLTGKIAASSSSSVTIAIDGSFDLRARSGRRGYAGQLSGSMTIDPRTHRLTRVRLLADGKAFGAGIYTPNQPPGKYRLLVGALETDRPESRLVPPEEVATYNRDTRYRQP